MTVEEKALTVANCVGTSEAEMTPHPYGSGRTYTPNYVTICSIWPEDMFHFALEGGRRKKYHLQAAPKGSYSLLRVYDTYTVIRNTQVDSAGPEGYAPAPKAARGIAENLVRKWALDAPGNAGGSQPGIMIIEGDTPTQLELDALWAQQVEYFRYLVRKGDEHWITGKRENVTEDHRRALRWLGSQDRDWMKEIKPVLFKRCKACAEEINANALKCKHCGTDLVRWYADSGIEPAAEEDAAVAAEMARRKARAAGKK